VPEGRVVSFNPEKGYGFIAPDDGGPQLFVHHSSIAAGGRQALPEGQRVSFAVERGAAGPSAVRVTPLSGAREAEPAATGRTTVPPASAPGGPSCLVAALLMAVWAVAALTAAYAFLAPAGWWSPSWLAYLVGALVGVSWLATRLYSK
jgi:CspA family cold shock protein